MSEDQLQQLLKEGGFLDDSPPRQFNQGYPGPNQCYNPRNHPPQQFNQAGFGSALSDEERALLLQAGVSLEYPYNTQPPPPPEPIYDVPRHEIPTYNPNDIQQMLAEFQMLSDTGTKEQNYDKFKNTTYQNYNVMRDAPVVHGLYDKRSSKEMYSMPVQRSKDNFSSYLVSA